MHTEGFRQRRLEDVGVSLLEVPEGGGDDDVRSQVGIPTLGHQQDLIVTFVPQDSAHGTVQLNFACWNARLRERENTHRRNTELQGKKRTGLSTVSSFSLPHSTGIGYRTHSSTGSRSRGQGTCPPLGPRCPANYPCLPRHSRSGQKPLHYY